MIDDVQAFLEAWRVAAPHQVTAKPDAAIRLALLRLGLGVAGRVVHGKSDGDAIKPFQAAVAKKEALNTDPSNIDVWTFRDGDRILVNARMGLASAVFAFDAKGRSLVVPASYAWSPGFDGPFRRAGKMVLFNAESIQDAGTRYRYRVGFLRRTVLGYVGAGVATGVSGYDAEDDRTPHVSASGARVIVRGLDEPRAFGTSSAVSVLKRTEIWSTTGTSAKRVEVSLGDPDLRAVDAWLLNHRRVPLGRGKRLPARLFADSFRRGPGWVELVFDAIDGVTVRFDLVQKDGRYVVLRARAI